MHQSNTTTGVFIVCLKTLFRHKRYLYLLFFFLFFPVYILINRFFLFLDYFFAPGISSTTVSNPMFIMGFNRSGTTFFHKFLSKSDQFTTATAWDMVLPSIVLRKLLQPLTYILSKLRFDRIEEKDKGHEVKLDQVEEDEMLLVLIVFIMLNEIKILFLFIKIFGKDRYTYNTTSQYYLKQIHLCLELIH